MSALLTERRGSAKCGVCEARLVHSMNTKPSVANSALRRAAPLRPTNLLDVLLKADRATQHKQYITTFRVSSSSKPTFPGKLPTTGGRSALESSLYLFLQHFQTEHTARRNYIEVLCIYSPGSLHNLSVSKQKILTSRFLKALRLWQKRIIRVTFVI